MKDQSEKKKKELCSKFDRLIKNTDQDDEAIGAIIIDMFDIDTGLAAELWEKALNMKQNIGNSLLGDILMMTQVSVGEDVLADIVVSHPVIKNAMFGQSSDCAAGLGVVETLFTINRIIDADKLLEMVYANKNTEFSEFLMNVLDYLLKNGKKVSEAGIDSFKGWIDRVKGEKSKARLDLKLQNITDDNDDGKDYEENKDDKINKDDENDGFKPLKWFN